MKMESALKNQRICRICMQDDMVLDWNLEIFKHSEMSFRDIYYRYSHLDEIESDPYPQFVCEACSLDLQNFHLFMEKAIETQKLLEQSFQSAIAEEDIQSEEESKPEMECVYIVENYDEWLEEMPEVKSIKVEPRRSERRKRRRPNFSDTEEDMPEQNSVRIEKLQRKTENTTEQRYEENTNSSEEIHIPAQKSTRKVSRKETKKRTVPVATIADDGADNVKSKRKTPVMCSFCSKVVHNAYYLKKHEQTHKEDRAREIICSICGLKTFNSVGLYNHMKIHQKNREKEFKCEFCDKAFFNRGACNVHRRIHLGQMVKCPSCPKEYYRQIDLDRHLPSHSSTPPQSANSRFKLKYMVHCKECDKQISSAKFNAHRAAHWNDPLMHCTVCEKDFFSRMACTRHMKRVHKRAKDAYDDIVTYYEKYRPRLSHVLMEQQEEVLTEHPT